MTDEQSNKRLKTTGAPGAGRRNMNDTRNDALESEIGALKSEVARLRQQLQRQNALLRPLLLSQRLRPLRLKENHETLPVTVSTLTTVNLSDIDTSLVAHVASFVGTSRELLNLALTCKAFGWCLGWCQHESEMWSLAEEVARRAVTTLQNSKSVKLILPEYVRGTRTWLSILHESDRPLKFNTLLGCHIAHSSGDRTSVRGTTERGHSGSAIASGFVMISGLHYAEFEIRGCPYIGIVRPMSKANLQRLAGHEDFDFFDMEVFDNCLAARCLDWGVREFGAGIVHACEYCCEDGYSSWTDWDDEQNIMNWEGMEDCVTGDTVGMLLNLDEGILTVYKNNRCLGVMKDGLSGSYCWYTTVTENSIVSIKRGKPPSPGGLPGFQTTDEQSNKRLKTTARIGRRNNDARNAADESEIGVLKSEVARLKQQLQRQNALLCPLLLSQRLRPLWLQENHNELSVTVSTLTKVNLSYIDTSLIAQVASFVGASRELRNLALTCKAFGWRQTGSDWDWSLAEEVARQIGRSGQNNIDGVRLSLPRYVRGRRTWLSILRESERPLKFNTLLGRHIEYSSGDRTSARNSAGRGYFGEALASGFVMMSGIHYAEFQIIGCVHVGIVRPMPNIILRMLARHETLDFFESEFYDDFLAARTDEWVGTVHTCEYSCEDGELSWTDWDIENEQEQFMVEWEGMEGCMTGDTIGMLLDLDEGKVTVYKNNRRLGVLKDGLSGPYCWYANVTTKSTVSIKRGEPPRI